LPYVAIFLAFVVYPIAFGIWMGSDVALYEQLFSDPRYLTAVLNTFLYVVIFLAFVLYPIIYGLWMGSDPALYRQLFDDPRYLTAVINTLLYVGIGVNVKMALAFLLSGFFMRKGW